MELLQNPLYILTFRKPVCYALLPFFYSQRLLPPQQSSRSPLLLICSSMVWRFASRSKQSPSSSKETSLLRCFQPTNKITNQRAVDFRRGKKSKVQRPALSKKTKQKTKPKTASPHLRPCVKDHGRTLGHGNTMGQATSCRGQKDQDTSDPQNVVVFRV